MIVINSIWHQVETRLMKDKLKEKCREFSKEKSNYGRLCITKHFFMERQPEKKSSSIT